MIQAPLGTSQTLPLLSTELGQWWGRLGAERSLRPRGSGAPDPSAAGFPPPCLPPTPFESAGGLGFALKDSRKPSVRRGFFTEWGSGAKHKLVWLRPEAHGELVPPAPGPLRLAAG